ncbi:hypothetical protein C2S51_018250 [Perilla frutescens var. frutescens]|nr:hypothetical protein C2S51_018250 [Perilla frutescens var. frutescens]
MQNSRFCCFSSLIFMSFCVVQLNCQNITAAKADVGVILDLDTILGKMCRTCISMAIEDFYSNRSHTTMMVPHFRDSSGGVVDAASAAIDLLKNTQVMAILGPQRSIQADFVIDIGERVRVPIISPATSPALSPKESPYFIRSAWSSSSQAKAIAAIVKKFGWREVVFVYEDTNHGSGLVPFLSVNLIQSNAVVSNLCAISPSAKKDQILQQLHNLKAMQTRVLIVHMHLPDLASSFFQMANKAGMMMKGYVWIIADPLTSLLSSVDSATIEAMQGVVGVKAYIPRSDQLMNFTRRWSKRFHEENPNIDRTELNVFGLWAYDSATALAEAIERVGVPSPRFKPPVNSSTYLETIGTSNAGPSLAPLIRNFASKGFSGDFNITNGELQPSVFEIVNVIGKGYNTVGFWTEKSGISKELKPNDHEVVHSTEMDNLQGILWPGQTSTVPNGWENPTSGKRLRVGVPMTSGRQSEFIKFERDAETNDITPTGFCIDVFTEIIKSMPYPVPYEYIPFAVHGDHAKDYDDFIYQIFIKQFDAMVGDVTISADRSSYVDFSAPYMESGVAIIVPFEDNSSKNTWIFMKPLTVGLWLTIGAFFLFTGFVIWILEHRINEEFQGPPLQQVGTMFWFSFSTLFFAHREKVMSNLTRFVVIVWAFAVLVLQSSYTANLTSMLTVQQLHPKDIYDLIKRGEHIGFRDISLIRGILNTKEVDKSKFRIYSSFEEYNEALSKGSKHGGVGAIVDELLSIRLFLSNYCHKYIMINGPTPTYKSSGYGFAFQKGSPLVPDVSRAIMQLKESGKLDEISRYSFGDEDRCLSSNGTDGVSKSLNLGSFKGLFIIAGLSSSSAVAIFLSIFLYKNQHTLTSNASIKQKLHDLARAFDGKNDDKTLPSSAESKTPGEMVSAQSSEIKISCDDGMSSPNEGFSSIELQPTQDALPPQEAH